MIVVPLKSLPNQSLSVQLDNKRYVLRFVDIGGMMAVDISIDEQIILEGHRVAGGLPLIPYQYLEEGGGNFLFLTELGDIVFWDQFEATQALLYLTVAELEVIRAD